MTVKIRKRQLKEKGRYALYLDIYAHQKQWQENLKLYLENVKGNSTIKQMNKQTIAIAERLSSSKRPKKLLSFVQQMQTLKCNTSIIQKTDADRS